MKTILLFLLIAFASCQKDEVVKPVEPPKATVYVFSSVRGQGTTIAYFQTRQDKFELLQSITFFYQAGTVGVPLAVDGRFSIVGHPATITGYFQLKYLDGRTEKTETKSYL
jgi:hypothetical protein